MARRPIAATALLGLLAALPLGGCGADYRLPTESRLREIPADSSYGMIATWTGMTGITDVLLTQGAGSQLFLVFNHGGTGLAPRGEVVEYALVRPEPIAGRSFLSLFNPVALGSGNNRIFVLDQGDTCLARANPNTGACDDTTGRWDSRISDLNAYWRVREYSLLGGDTLGTFTDTSLAWVEGIAVDAQNNVYVAGTAIVVVPNPDDYRLYDRFFQYRIFKYVRGPRYPGVTPPDRNMPGANWHRDTTFMIEEGSGIGSVVDPRGMSWNAFQGGALYVADRGKNWAQKLYDQGLNQGYYQLDGSASGTPFLEPSDVAVDAEGSVYVCDRGNRRVVRYDAEQNYIQRVDIEPDASLRPLQDPAAIAADDSLVYVADPATAQIVRYKRRK